jgi:pyridoxamine 5'-phosphate oxidase
VGDDLKQPCLPDLDETTIHPDPFQQFHAWFEAAQAASLRLPEAMTLATATRDGRPSARLVLLRGFDAGGFVFFTNYHSRKSRELAENPWAALVCHWAELERQVRIEGHVTAVTPAESDAYFESRPRGSRLAAWAATQSDVIAGREVLETRMRDLEERFSDRPVPRPPYWGGYRVAPHIMEFWQGRPNRLHNRFRYQRLEDGRWRIERLAP